MACAAPMILESLSEDFLTCSICQDDFVQPKQLPCLHSFCFVCLDTYVDDKRPGMSFACPVCRKDTRVPREGLTSFPDNFQITGLQDLVRKHKTDTTPQSQSSSSALAQSDRNTNTKPEQPPSNLKELEPLASQRARPLRFSPPLSSAARQNLPWEIHLYDPSLSSSSDEDDDFYWLAGNSWAEYDTYPQTRSPSPPVHTTGYIAVESSKSPQRRGLLKTFNTGHTNPVAVDVHPHMDEIAIVFHASSLAIGFYDFDGGFDAERSYACSNQVSKFCFDIKYTPVGNIVVSDFRDGEIVTLSPDGMVLNRFDVHKCSGIAMSNKYMYVSSLGPSPEILRFHVTNRNACQVIYPTDTWLNNHDCELVAPRYLAINKANLAVSDKNAKRIRFVETKDFQGSYVYDDDDLDCPYGTCSDYYKENTIVADRGSNTILLIGKNNQFIRNLVSCHDGLVKPQGVCVLGKGRILVTQANGMVKIFAVDDTRE